MDETNFNPLPDNLSIIKESAPSSEVPIDKRAALETKKYEGEVEREERLKDHLHKVFLCFLWLAFLIFVIVFIARVVHFIIPEDWQWLTAEQVQGIDKLIFSGTIGGFIGRYFNRFNPKHQ